MKPSAQVLPKQQLKPASQPVIQQSSQVSLNDAKKRPADAIISNQIKKMKPSEATQTSSKPVSNTASSNKVKQSYSSTYHISSSSNNTEYKSMCDLVKLDKIPDVPPSLSLSSIREKLLN